MSGSMGRLPLAMHRAILIVDVEGFSDRRRTHSHQMAVRDGMYRVLREAFSRSRIPWDDCYREDRGDGVLILVPPEVPKSLLTGPLPGAIVAGLRRHNAVSCPEARMRLRLAVHAGEVLQDDTGVVGSAVIHAFRLSDVRALKSALAGSPGVLAVVVSDWIYHEVVRHNPAIMPDDYREIQVAEKEARATAWIHIPDHPAGRPDVIRPGRGLQTLPPSVWASAEVREAACLGVVGSIVATARRAHGLTQARLGAMAGLSKHAIGRLEAHGGRVHDIRVLRTLQRVLGIPAHLLGLTDQAVLVRPQAAQQLLGEVPSAHASVAVDGHALLSLLSIDPTTTHHLLVLRRVVNDADNYGRPAALKPTVRELCEFTDRLRRSASGEFRRQLLAVGAVYAEFYGWLHEQTHDLREATYWTTQALQQAQAADDPDAIAYATVRMAELAALEEDNDRVMGLLRAAKQTSGVSPVVRAMLLRQEASALSRAGDRSCMNTLDEAKKLVGNRQMSNADEYEIGYCFTERHLDVQRGACLLRLGELDEAIIHYEHLRWGNVCQWERGVHTAKLAVAHAFAGDLEQTVLIASEALELARSTGSTVITRELRALAPWITDPKIAEVAENANVLHANQART
ncbi:hypothetical protein Lesp02_73550 [Lentzea sp. NBRC 105346]|uniref:helix-turn-helix domain-containing protein n=1 Tax=Lentzea sp. NBRC 105346 TaxID=3032205 RepID=UPI0024A3D37A|nr:helix-turn-helix domain-containing protein [Lentzea sp. NBRC 105346]GLZ35168.1 hypothetical protein Lesp02_73550 [Lentzea sp. NBRC 105346]